LNLPEGAATEFPPSSQREGDSTQGPFLCLLESRRIPD
jgi:hypothetical protein